MVHPDKGIVFSNKKKSKLSNHKKACRNFNYGLLSKSNQSEKAMYCMILSIQHSGKGKKYGDSKKMSGHQRLERRSG